MKGIKARDKEHLIGHITNKHYIHNGLFGCPSCDYRTEDISLVLKHISTRHDELKVIEVLWENL